jgi:hypothetical protein
MNEPIETEALAQIAAKHATGSPHTHDDPPCKISHFPSRHPAANTANTAKTAKNAPLTVSKIFGRSSKYFANSLSD